MCHGVRSGDMGHSHYNNMQNLKDDAAAGLIDVVVRTQPPLIQYDFSQAQQSPSVW